MTSRCRLFLIRHGQAAMPDANGRVHNYSAVPLTERGRAQADEVSGLLSLLAIDAVITSDLARARETAETIARDRAPMLVDPRLREVDIGDFEGMTLSRLGQIDPGFLPWLEVFFHERFASSSFHVPSHITFPGGESVEAMQGRLRPVLCEIAARYRGKTAVLVSHAWAIQSLLCHVTHTDIRNYHRFAYANCVVTMVEVDDDGRGTLACLNNNLGLSGAAGGRLAAEPAGDVAAAGATGDRAMTCRVLLIPTDGGHAPAAAGLAGVIRLAAIHASPSPSSVAVATALGNFTEASPVVDRRLGDPELAGVGLRELAHDHRGSTVAICGDEPVMSALTSHVTGSSPGNAHRFPAVTGGMGLVEVEADGRGMLHIWNGGMPPADLAGRLRPGMPIEINAGGDNRPAIHQPEAGSDQM